jgi:hypothetical protein
MQSLTLQDGLSPISLIQKGDLTVTAAAKIFREPGATNLFRGLKVLMS